jgi:hypothetical protein
MAGGGIFLINGDYWKAVQLIEDRTILEEFLTRLSSSY